MQKSNEQTLLPLISVMDIKEAVRDCLYEFFKEPTHQVAVLPEPPDLIEWEEASIETGYAISYLKQLKRENALPFIQKSPHGKVQFSRKELRSWKSKGRPHILKEAIEKLSNDLFKQKGGIS